MRPFNRGLERAFFFSFSVESEGGQNNLAHSRHRGEDGWMGVSCFGGVFYACSKGNGKKKEGGSGVEKRRGNSMKRKLRGGGVCQPIRQLCVCVCVCLGMCMRAARTL